MRYGDIDDYKGAGVMQAVVSGAKQLMNMMGLIMAAYGEGGSILLLVHTSLSCNRGACTTRYKPGFRGWAGAAVQGGDLSRSPCADGG